MIFITLNLKYFITINSTTTSSWYMQFMKYQLKYTISGQDSELIKYCFCHYQGATNEMYN